MFEFEDIYNTLIGNDTDEFAVGWVENINVEGSPYARAYQELWDACKRLCIRLGIDSCRVYEEEDIEIILESMFTMQREVAFGMFHCGMEYRNKIHDP